MNIFDNHEILSENENEDFYKRFQLFEDLQTQIENLLLKEFHGLFFKNELQFEKNKLKLPSMYLYDIHDYKFIFEENIEDDMVAPAYRPTLKQKLESFITISYKNEHNYGDEVEFNTLSLIEVKPETLFALIGDKLIFSESNSYFEGYLGPFPSNFIILEFEEGKLLDFVLQFVSLYYLLVIFEKLLITMSNINVPYIKSSEITYLEEEILKLKKTQVLRTKLILSEIFKEIFSCLRIFDYFSNNDFEFNEEETSSRFLIKGKSWDNDSVSKYFNDLLSYRKEAIEKRQTHLQERISDINNFIVSELSLTKDKPKINGAYKKIETDLILQIKKWNGTIISQDKIETWLSNFNSKEDRIAALKLLDKLTYITYQEMRPFITAAYNTLLYSINSENLKNYYVSPIGKPTSGSNHLAKLFQEENRIDDYLLIPFDNLESLIKTDNKKDTVILIDDFIGSGNTYIK